MEKRENIEVFHDTERLCKTNKKLSETIKNSTVKQTIVLENDKIESPNLNRFAENAKVIVSKKRTLFSEYVDVLE